MKAKCIVEGIGDFTFGRVYDVDHIDHDGDVWVLDDNGDFFFMYPDECEVFE